MTNTYEDFGEEFQTQILAYLFRDTHFLNRCEGLVQPEYFTTEVHASLAKLANDYFAVHKGAPSRASMNLILKEAFDKKRLKVELKPEIIQVVKDAFAEELTDIDFVAEKVTKFARKQALENAIVIAAEKIDKGDYEGVEELIQKAQLVGQKDDDEQVDFWKEAENRMKHREAIEAGLVKPDGITTGFKDMDDVMYHKGWGRQELSLLMGPAKSGKSMALVTFGVKAALAGYNVLYVSLEVSKRIIQDRMDANLSGVKINDLTVQMKKVRDEAVIAGAKAGHLKVHDYASGTFTPNQLRRLLARYAAAGINFDEVIVDYADLMAPDRVSNEPRENSRMIYVALRGIAHEYNCALLTATQTNRAGFKAAVGDMEHVSDDINKVRTVDLMISLNRDEEDKINGTARLYFAASRNQGSCVIHVQADIASARYVSKVNKVED